MATLNVVNYNLLTDLIMKVNNDDQSNSTGAITNTGSNNLSKAFNKITVQNILSESSGSVLNVANSNNPNAIVRKIKDFGMIGSVNNAASITLSVISSRKRPLQENKLQHNAANKEKRAESSNPSSNTATGKKPKLTKEERAALRAARKAAKENSLALTKLQKSATDFKCIVKQPGTPGRKALPLPQAVARRNARERNRVKQVNNGFAALRERIPDELAESFEAQYSNSRGSGKKLSKVETLRMAVEYIRGLERLLGFDFSNENEAHRSASSGEDSFILIKDEFDVLSLLPHEPLDDSFNQSLVHVQNAANTDIYPDVTTLNGLQYMRIPGTNTYQLISPDIYASGLNSPTSSSLDDEPHLYSNLIDAHCLSPPETIAPVSTADLLHSSSALINVPHIINGTNAITTAPAIIAAAPAIRNGSKCVNEGTSPSELNLLKSPVPQAQPAVISAASSTSLSTTATSLSSSPTPNANTTSSSLHQPITTPPATTTTIITATQPSELSPAAANKQLDLRQTCASNQQLLQQQTTIFTEPNSTYLKSFIQQYKDNSKDDVNLIYQTCINSQQQQQQQQQQGIRELQTQEQQLFVNSNASLDNPPVSINTSPVNLTTCSPAHLSTFYDNHGSENPQSFFTEVVTLKKDFDDTLLESTHNNPVLSDESLIESIDWWETQTHKSDGSTLL